MKMGLIKYIDEVNWIKKFKRARHCNQIRVSKRLLLIRGLP